MELSRKEKFAKGEKKGVSKKVKTLVAATGLTVLFGTGTVFGASDIGVSITNYVNAYLSGEVSEVQALNSTAQETDFDSFLGGLIATVKADIAQKSSDEQQRVEDEINAELTRVKSEAQTQLDIEKGNALTELETTADAEIQSGKDALDQVFQNHMNGTVEGQ